MQVAAMMARQLFKVQLSGEGAILSTRRSDRWHVDGNDAREVRARLHLDERVKARAYCYGRDIGGKVELELGGEVPRHDWPEW